MPHILKKLNDSAIASMRTYEDIIETWDDFFTRKDEEDILEYLNEVFKDLCTGYFIRECICKRFGAVYDAANNVYKIPIAVPDAAHARN